MKTAYVVKAHVEDDGCVVSDETVPFPPGPVKVTVTRVAPEKKSANRFAARTRRLKAILKKIDAIKTPKVPKDKRTIDETLYG